MEPIPTLELAEWGNHRYPCKVNELGIAVITGPAVERIATDRLEQIETGRK